MKTMNYIKIGIASSILSIAAGCTSFLEEDLKSSLAPDNTYTSSLGFEVGATGLYAIARSEYNTWGENGAFMHNGACAYEVLQISTDLCRMGTVRDGSLVPFAEMTLNPSTLFVGSYWNWAYNLIASANELLIYSEKNNNWDYPTDKQLYQAEARFFRAYAYRWSTSTATCPGSKPSRSPSCSRSRAIPRSRCRATSSKTWNLPRRTFPTIPTT